MVELPVVADDKITYTFSYGLTETTGGVAVNDITEFRVGRTGGVLDS